MLFFTSRVFKAIKNKFSLMNGIRGSETQLPVFLLYEQERHYRCECHVSIIYVMLKFLFLSMIYLLTKHAGLNVLIINVQHIDANDTSVLKEKHPDCFHTPSHPVPAY